MKTKHIMGWLLCAITIHLASGCGFMRAVILEPLVETERQIAEIRRAEAQAEANKSPETKAIERLQQSMENEAHQTQQQIQRQAELDRMERESERNQENVRQLFRP